MKIELNDFWRCLAPRESVASSLPSFSIIALAT